MFSVQLIDDIGRTLTIRRRGPHGRTPYDDRDSVVGVCYARVSICHWLELTLTLYQYFQQQSGLPGSRRTHTLRTQGPLSRPNQYSSRH